MSSKAVGTLAAETPALARHLIGHFIAGRLAAVVTRPLPAEEIPDLPGGAAGPMMFLRAAVVGVDVPRTIDAEASIWLRVPNTRIAQPGRTGENKPTRIYRLVLAEGPAVACLREELRFDPSSPDVGKQRPRVGFGRWPGAPHRRSVASILPQRPPVIAAYESGVLVQTPTGPEL